MHNKENEYLLNASGLHLKQSYDTETTISF